MKEKIQKEIERLQYYAETYRKLVNENLDEVAAFCKTRDINRAAQRMKSAQDYREAVEKYNDRIAVLKALLKED